MRQLMSQTVSTNSGHILAVSIDRIAAGPTIYEANPTAFVLPIVRRSRLMEVLTCAAEVFETESTVL
jgi:hypothetical protein